MNLSTQPRSREQRWGSPSAHPSTHRWNSLPGRVIACCQPISSVFSIVLDKWAGIEAFWEDGILIIDSPLILTPPSQLFQRHWHDATSGGTSGLHFDARFHDVWLTRLSRVAWWTSEKCHTSSLSSVFHRPSPCRENLSLSLFVAQPWMIRNDLC